MQPIDIPFELPLEERLNILKTHVLVADIETSAHYPDGTEININSNYDDYVKYAIVKWLGFYSYKLGKEFVYSCNDDKSFAIQLLSSHQILVGHNLQEFDYPILINNGFIDDPKHNIIDNMVILGHSSYMTKKGYPYKNRGQLMDYDFAKNSLRHMGEVMGCNTIKGEIDYKIFHKTEWTPQEENQIIRYLLGDIMVSKEMFNKLWEYWKPFTKFIPSQAVYDLSWIKSSIAALVYKSACAILGVEATYSDEGGKAESMGGNVIEPKYEEATKVWYIDFSSLYPHIMSMFNLFNETAAQDGVKNVWHGNEMFQVRGYYDITELHPLSKAVMEFLKQRITLKKTDPTNPMVYTLKIWLNGLYGVVRSPIFNQVHKKNAGWDTCWLGQQFQAYVVKRFSEFGFETIAGDTDSAFIRTNNDEHNSVEYVKSCIKTIVAEIAANVPFKAETFDIAIEHFIDYIMWPFDEQDNVSDAVKDLINATESTNYESIGYIEKVTDKKKTIVDLKTGEVIKSGRSWTKRRRGMKKNYMFIYTKKDGTKEIEIKGFPIIKANATKLGPMIFSDVLKTKMLEQGHAKFDKAYIDSLIDKYLQSPEIMDSISQEYKVKPASSYKKENQIQAQISKAYFFGGEGTIRLIKNTKVGKVGKGILYCSLQEAKNAKLTAKELDLEKLNNELAPFCKLDSTTKDVI